MEPKELIKMLSLERQKLGVDFKELSTRTDTFASDLRFIEREKENLILDRFIRCVDALGKCLVICKGNDKFAIESSQDFCKWFKIQCANYQRKEIAKMSGITTQWVNNIYNNRCGLTIKTMLKLTNVFDCYIEFADTSQADEIKHTHSITECLLFLEQMRKELQTDVPRKTKIIEQIKNIIKQ